MTGTHSIPSSAVRGWAVSFLYHGLAVGMAVTLFADLKLVPEKEPFRWQVSQVVTPSLEPTSEAQPSEAVAQPAPVPPTRAREVARVTPQKPTPQVTEVRQVETKPVAQAVQAQTMEMLERPIARPVTREMKAVQTEQPAEVMSKTGPVTAERATVTRESAAAVAPASVEAVAPAAVQHAQSQPTQAPIQEAMVRPKPAEPAARHDVLDPPPSEPPAPLREGLAVEAIPVRAAPGTKTDYGWLADTLRRRVAEVKRYPHEARLNHWHGKVVLHAVIKDDGHLADLRVHESSGHEVLDEAAMEAVRHACPLDLKHPLGRHQVAIRIPINYTLND